MKTTFVQRDGYRATVDNDRGHEVVIDLPEAAGGTNKGPKAFELLAMSLSGCVGTIFVDVAKKMRLNVSDVRVELDAKCGETIEEVKYKLFVKSDDPMAKLERCLTLTEKTCPVGVLFHKAGVPFEHEIVVL